jgi:hypothetical protein
MQEMKDKFENLTSNLSGRRSRFPVVFQEFNTT